MPDSNWDYGLWDSAIWDGVPAALSQTVTDQIAIIERVFRNGISQTQTVTDQFHASDNQVNFSPFINGFPTWQIGTLPLTFSPSRIMHSDPALYEKFKFTGGSAALQQTGLDLETLTVNLTLFNGVDSIEQLANGFYLPLKRYLGSTVWVNFPITEYNGVWLMKEIQSDTNNKSPNRLFCTIKFVKGSSIVVL